MSVVNFAILTAAERTVSMQGGTGWGNGVVEINPRAVDNASPGVGLNLNPDADNFDGGAVVPLAGKFVANKRIVDDPDYQAHAPDLVAFLLTLPWAMLEGETIFAPDPPV